MRDYNVMSEMMERIIHKYNQLENRKRTYGTEQLLSRAEIHTIAVVGDQPNINITTLAKVLGITKGAASQMIYKLVDKGVIEKRISPESDTEVVLTLTADGTINYENHRAYHQQNNERIFEELQDVPDDLYQQMMLVLTHFDKTLEERINHKA